MEVSVFIPQNFYSCQRGENFETAFKPSCQKTKCLESLIQVMKASYFCSNLLRVVKFASHNSRRQYFSTTGCSSASKHGKHNSINDFNFKHQLWQKKKKSLKRTNKPTESLTGALQTLQTMSAMSWLHYADFIGAHSPFNTVHGWARGGLIEWVCGFLLTLTRTSPPDPST